MEQNDNLKIIFNEVKLFLHFGPTDLVRLRQVEPIIKPRIPSIVDTVIKRISANAKLVSLTESYPLPLKKARTIFEGWLDRLFSSEYDINFARYIYDIGIIHEKAGISPKYVTMTMSIFLMAIDYILNEKIPEKAAVYAHSHSIKKAVFLNMTLMVQSYEEAKRQKILQSINLS